MSTTILGANGKLGAILTAYARRAELNWRTQSRNCLTDINWSGDFNDPVVEDLFQRGGTVINMIGRTTGDAGTFTDINVNFVQKLLTQAAQSGVAHVILASSAAVYGAGNGRPFVESDPLHPLTPYGTSKMEMEHVAHAFCDETAPAVTILRIGNVAGADAITTAAKQHIAVGTPMRLHRLKNGKATTRSYIGPYDLFRTVRNLAAPHKGPPRVVNVAHNQPVTLDMLLAAYRTHVMPDLRWTDEPVPDQIPIAVTLSAKKLQNFVNLHELENATDAFATQVAEYLIQ